MNRRLGLLLTLATAAVLAQQQILLRRPPRLVQIRPQHLHSGSAGLDLNFSRPMQLKTVESQSHLKPALRHHWLGSHAALRLILTPTTAIKEPVRLHLAGRDQRMNALTAQTWWWDPRPWLLVTRDLKNGQQLQLLDRQGTWRPVSPIWTKLSAVVPLGNGRGVAVVASDDNQNEQIWLQPLQPRSLQHDRRDLAPPKRLPVQQLISDNVLFGHISSNLNGDLLVQTGGFLPETERNELIQANGKRRQLDLPSAGPMELLPGGGGLVVPSYDGINLMPLANKGGTMQSLPGNRELGAFCAASGRALLIRHWPDYRRSIELVLPGVAPRQLWLGEQAVLGVACDGKGERIWAVIGQWTGDWAEHTLLLLDGEGRVAKRQSLGPWRMKGGTPLQFDPVSGRLLFTVIREQQREAHPALVDAVSLQLQEVLPIAVEQALWLNP